MRDNKAAQIAERINLKPVSNIFSELASVKTTLVFDDQIHVFWEGTAVLMLLHLVVMLMRHRWDCSHLNSLADRHIPVIRITDTPLTQALKANRLPF